MTSKRQFEKQTIITSQDQEDIIKNHLAITIKKMWKFAFTLEGNNRSSSKTDLLHASLENVLKDSFGDYKDVFIDNFELIAEKENVNSKKTNRINQIKDIFGSTFKVDMLMLNKLDNSLNTVFLLKAPLTSINKNRYNSVLNNFGEIDRFYGNPENKDIELVFINFTPKVSFLVSDNNYLRKEIVNYIGLNKSVNGLSPLEKLPKSVEIKSKIHEIHIEYELKFNKEIEEIFTKDDLKNQIELNSNFVLFNEKALEELKKYINHFITMNNNLLKIDINDENQLKNTRNQLRLKF